MIILINIILKNKNFERNNFKGIYYKLNLLYKCIKNSNGVK